MKKAMRKAKEDQPKNKVFGELKFFSNFPTNLESKQQK